MSARPEGSRVTGAGQAGARVLGIRVADAEAAVNAVRPVDRLVTAYNVVLAMLWGWVAVAGVPASSSSGLAYSLDPGLAAALAVAHAAGAGFPLFVSRLPACPGLALRLLREAYPLLLLPAFWLELDPLIRSLHVATWDGAIIAFDRALFGLHLERVWMPAMPQAWFSELMHFSYWIYMPLIFVPGLVVGARRDAAAFQDVALRLMATYVGCYLIYVSFPTAGPKAFGVPLDTPVTSGLFYGLVAAAQETGTVYGAAFPSSHVAGAVTVAWLGWRYLSRVPAALLTLQAVGVLLSTVYTQHHYAIDSVAGAAFALAVQGWAVAALRRTGRPSGARRPSREPVPPLATPPGRMRVP